MKPPVKFVGHLFVLSGFKFCNTLSQAQICEKEVQYCAQIRVLESQQALNLPYFALVMRWFCELAIDTSVHVCSRLPLNYNSLFYT